MPDHRSEDERLPLGAIKTAVYEAMPAAYAEASDNGSWPADGRQIGYAVRRISGLGDKLRLKDYFLAGPGGGLLTRYLAEHAEETADWDVIRDPRGSLYEPHTETEVELGTKAVREYLASDEYQRGRSWSEKALRERLQDSAPPTLNRTIGTKGPLNCYGAAVYIEKEGFGEQLRAARVGDRWDVAILSNKGYSNHATRRLLAAFRKEHDLPVLVAHDFDGEGIGIYDTFAVEGLIDIGLRLADIEDERWGLAAMSEGREYKEKKGKPYDPRPNLRLRGATEEEIEFLVQPQADGRFLGRRVELNALVGRTFIDWLESKLQEHGIEKIVPDQATLDYAYRYAYARELVNRAIEEAHEEAIEEALALDVPEDLVSRLTEGLTASTGAWSTSSWRGVLAGLVDEDLEEDEDDAEAEENQENEEEER